MRCVQQMSRGGDMGAEVTRPMLDVLGLERWVATCMSGYILPSDIARVWAALELPDPAPARLQVIIHPESAAKFMATSAKPKTPIEAVRRVAEAVWAGNLLCGLICKDAE